jgi:hypothetical protein
MANMPKSKSISQLLNVLEELKKKDLDLTALFNDDEKVDDQTESTEVVDNTEVSESEVSQNEPEIKEIENVEATVKEETPSSQVIEPSEATIESVGLNRLFNKNHIEQQATVSKIVPREKPITFSEIADNWETWSNQLGDGFSNHLKRILATAKPKELNRHTLTIIVTDHFSKEMIDSNERLIEQSLLSFYNSVLSLDCLIVQDESNTKVEYLDPIDQLLKLQQTEPKIKTIVELFGAEPDF